MSSEIDKQIENILKNYTEDENDSSISEEEEVVHEPLLPIIYEDKESKLTLNDNDDKTDDYKFARSNLYGLVGRTNAALEIALNLAQMSEHPRALEVVATLIKTSSDVSKDIIKIHRELEEGNNPKQPLKQNNTQINNYYSKERETKDINDLLDNHDDKEK